MRPKECHSCKTTREKEEARQKDQQLHLERVAIREKWRRNCGIPETLLLRTFDNFIRDLQPKAIQAAMEWAEGFWKEGPKGYPSLLFYSEDHGVGKTHLMVAIVNLVIHSWEGEPNTKPRSPVRFESGPGLVRRLRATYNLRPGDYKHEREEDVYASMRGVNILMLDDVGKERASDHTRELYWYIVDERVKSGLPVVVSSKLPLEGEGSLETLMGEDTVDRLVGMIRGKIIHMKGESYRRSHFTP